MRNSAKNIEIMKRLLRKVLKTETSAIMIGNIDIVIIDLNHFLIRVLQICVIKKEKKTLRNSFSQQGKGLWTQLQIKKIEN